MDIYTIVIIAILTFATGLLFGCMFGGYTLDFLNIKSEVYRTKKTLEKTNYNLDIERLRLDFLREYPEANQQEQCDTNVIGFYQEKGCEEYIDEEENIEDKKCIGFRK